MTIDEVIQLVNAKSDKTLNPVQEILLREVWVGQTYADIASNFHYGERYLRNAASLLWQSISEIFHTSITKSNFRSTLESLSLNDRDRKSIQDFNRRQLANSPLEFPSGPVPLDSPFYIKRSPIEELTQREIAQPGSIIRIKAPRKMGKSSLLLRILDRAVGLGYCTVSLDFQQAEESVLENLDKFLRWFCANISRQLELPSQLDEYWDEDMGSKVSCTIYLQGYLLPQIQKPLALALNEVNRLFEYPKLTKEFLPLLRSWHEEAKRIKILQNLRMIVLHSTEIYVPLKLNESPFNVGLPIHLPPFTEQQILMLANLHGLQWDSAEAGKLMAMVGGHPYLVRLALYHLCYDDITLEQLLEEAPTMAGIYKNYLRYLWVTLQDEPELASALQKAISSGDAVELEPIVAYKLDSIGLIHLDGDRATVSCQLYRQFFASKTYLHSQC